MVKTDQHHGNILPLSTLHTNGNKLTYLCHNVATSTAFLVLGDITEKGDSMYTVFTVYIFAVKT